MNQIAFRWVEGRRKEPVRLTILIDGRDLVDRLREHELPLAEAEGHPELAGAYGGLDPAAGDLRAHLLGDPATLYRTDEHTEVLTCDSCGEPGCWPLHARIVVGAASVEWRDFRQPHRPNWDYEAFGPFVFSREDYLAALEALNVLPRGFRSR